MILKLCLYQYSVIGVILPMGNNIDNYTVTIEINKNTVTFCQWQSSCTFASCINVSNPLYVNADLSLGLLFLYLLSFLNMNTLDLTKKHFLLINILKSCYRGKNLLRPLKMSIFMIYNCFIFMYIIYTGCRMLLHKP